MKRDSCDCANKAAHSITFFSQILAGRCHTSVGGVLPCQGSNLKPRNGITNVRLATTPLSARLDCTSLQQYMAVSEACATVVKLLHVTAVHELHPAAEALQHSSLDGCTQRHSLLRVHIRPDRAQHSTTQHDRGRWQEVTTWNSIVQQHKLEKMHTPSQM